jgi:two-component system sensor histidine kinase KdpD
VGRQLDDVGEVVAALSRAAGTALDPSSILSRTMAVLEPVLGPVVAELWRDAGSPELVAVHPAPRRGVPLVPVIGSVGDAFEVVSMPLEARSHPLGRLVVVAASREVFNVADQALLDIAATQIAGALERAQLFSEVMELERLKTDFIARVSHELRTPITIIHGFLETLIAHDGRLDAEQRLHMLERSRTAAERLGDLIEELLLLSRIEGGVLTPQPETLVARELLEAVRSAATEPDQVLVGGDLDGRVTTDRTLAVRALGMLVDNAVKYGGVAELSARSEPGRWVVEVRDRGPGFADDVLGVAFEMFTRSQEHTAIPGLGVGLPIARTLIEVLDGTVVIDLQHPGPGALVRVSLPA